MTTVNVSADALVVLRADSELSNHYQINDPTAPWFVTEQGQLLYNMAKSLDRVYVEFNMARYHFFEQQLKSAFQSFEQVIIVGSGYDTRAIRLASDSPQTQVFEIDLPQVIESKQVILQEQGLAIPESVKLLGIDLKDSSLKELLSEKGYNPLKATFVMIEGVVFFLSADVTVKLFNPDFFGLAQGSQLLFDYWTTDRVKLMNQRVTEAIGKRFFHPIAYCRDECEICKQLKHYYQSCNTQPLQAIAKQNFGVETADEIEGSWRIAQCKL